jgi:hypothetical protein
MRAPVINAIRTRARNLRGDASSSARCSSEERMRVRRLSSRSRLTLCADDSSTYPHSTAFVNITRNVSSSRLTVPGRFRYRRPFTRK